MGAWFLRFSAGSKMGFNFINHVCSSEDISQSLEEYFGCMVDNFILFVLCQMKVSICRKLTAL